MSFLLNLMRQTGAVLNQQSLARKVLLLAIIVGSVLAMVWLATRARTGGYVVLYSGLDPAETGRATARLVQSGIEAQPDNGGTTLKVERNRVDEAAILLAQEEIPSTGGAGYELLGESPIGQSKFQQEKNYLRMRENELARTLQSIDGIERARVHLAIPDSTVFLKETEAPTASVTVRLRRGTVLNDRQIRGITFLVSRSVEGMSPENVSLIDTEGNMLNAETDPASGDFSATYANFRAAKERELKESIESMLEETLGRGRVVARVQAEYDFATLHQVKESYNPDEQDPIITRESATREFQTSRNATVQVGEGAEMAEAEAAPAPGANAGGILRENTQTEYSVSKVVQESESRSPKLQRLSVAVLVDGEYEELTGEDGQVKREFRERSPEEMKKYEELVKSAIGFTQNEERNDVISIQCAPFAFDTVEQLDEPFLNYEMQRLLEQVIQWGVVGLLGLLIVLFVLRPALKQVLVTPIQVGPHALPAGAAGLGALTAGGESDGAVPGGMDANELERLAERLRSDKSLSEEVRQEMLAALRNDPETAKAARRLMDSGRGDSGHLAELQKLASRYVRESTAESHVIHREVMEVASQNPQKAVSLIRQWMDEA
ncbi:MAG TPA: flagellar basal-body MS-ring/collar protein FliF [Candidatus Sumerlaeota bacterium]|nr:MAG: Flagellar M-ring protein [candidate division BRC1 bacterium ADurb.BinA292]HOE94973.1 flagellar basal-body MS-ring/collar protein FliF [Candidatus Sumerlaeota bacterium]HOR28835.1 flagellar basal-body MS-ring/collar protein FliF [Candidatus Sumerlaeota bacterium]